MQNVELKIRNAVAADAEMLAKISWQSFHDAFADHPANHPDDMKVYMDEAFSPTTLADELKDPDSFFFIAEIENEIVGYSKIKMNSREHCIEDEKPIELCRLYALQNYIGKGIGKALMMKGLEFAKENKFETMWLGVWEFNYNAQKFYAKYGFEKCGEHIFQLGSDPQTDWIMQLKLASN